MPNIQIKRSAISGSVPNNLLDGEIALNTIDRLFFTKDSSGTRVFLNFTSDAEKVASGPIANALSLLAPKLNASFTGITNFVNRPIFNNNVPWDNGNLKPIGYNVLVYGADATGTNSSSIAFQAALDAIAALGTKGGTLIIPQGTYRLDTAVIFSQNNAPLTIIGEGRGTVIIQNAATAISYTAKGRFEIRNLMFIQNNAGGSCLSINTAAEYIISNIRAYTSSSTAYWDYFFYVQNPLLGSVSDVYIVNQPPTGFGIDSSKIRGNGFHGVANASISTNNSFNNVFIQGFYNGWYFSSSVNPGNEGNTFVNCCAVDVMKGVYSESSYNGPQQFSWFGGHINAFIRCFELASGTTVQIQGALLYRDCRFNLAGQFIFISTLSNTTNYSSGAEISHNTLRCINNDSSHGMGNTACIHLDGGSFHTVAFNNGIVSSDAAYAVFCSSTNSDIHFNRFSGAGLNSSSGGVTVTGSGGATTGNRIV